MKLSSIILEQETVDVSPLSQIDDLIKKELEAAQEKQGETNEIVGTTALFLIALPGILRGIDGIVRAIRKKAGIDLSKPGKNLKAWNSVIAVAEKIDSYTDAPVNAILTPFISDVTKRKKIASIIKGLALATMTMGSNIGISESPELVNIIKNYMPEVGNEVIQTIVEKSGPKLIEVAKKLIQSILK